MPEMTLRLSEELDRLITQEAKREGISKAQYAREAIYARAAYALGRRGDPGWEQVIALVTRRAR